MSWKQYAYAEAYKQHKNEKYATHPATGNRSHWGKYKNGKTRYKRKRRPKIITLFLLPFTIPLFLLGWCLSEI